MTDSLIIIPTYNEIGNIEKMVRKVFSLPKEFDLLIIDDGSPDGTAQKVKELQEVFKGRLFLLERAGKQGLGTAYIAGFSWALAKDYQYIFEPASLIQGLR
jgi:dolichol-phosphate mannosyltransferase